VKGHGTPQTVRPLRQPVSASKNPHVSQQASAKKLKLDKAAVMRIAHVESQRIKNFGLEIRGRKPTDTEIKEHWLRRMAFTGNDVVWRCPRVGDFYHYGNGIYQHDDSSLDGDESLNPDFVVLGLDRSPLNPTTSETTATVTTDQQERGPIKDKNKDVQSVPSMADVSTPHVSPVEGLENAKDMRTPTMDSPKILPGGQVAPPTVTGNETPPMGGEFTADEKSIHGKETALMAVASASVSKLSIDMEWVVDSGASAHIAKDRSMFVSYVPVRGTVECGATEHRSIGMATVRLVIEDTDGRDRVIYLRT
jgi:hypothetical protein